MNAKSGDVSISNVGRPVNFSAPDNVKSLGAKDIKGLVIDEIWQDPSFSTRPVRNARSTTDWGDYSLFSQLIKWEDNTTSIRLGYYRRSPGKQNWRFASQWTITDEPAKIRSLLEKTLAKSDWFK